MYIRKYIVIGVSVILVFLAIFGIGYQAYHSKDNFLHMDAYGEDFRFTRAADDRIQIYKDGKWEDMKVRGVEVSSFRPGYERNRTKMDKKIMMEWLGDIADLGANVIKIPSIQAPSFYNAIYDFNENRDRPIYTIHEVKLDEKVLLKYYDVYNEKLAKTFKKDIRKTINVVHGRAFLASKKRNHTGLYVKDISKYNLGYILGTNTNPEAVTLSNSQNPAIESYQGDYISLEEGSPFEVFVARNLDYAAAYERDKYDQVSLLSYLTAVETDPIDYKYETRITRNADIDMNDIYSSLDNLFVAYSYHPNSADFLDYEYQEDEFSLEDYYKSDFYVHLRRLKSFYHKPLLISDTGISSSRAISKLDIRDNFNRGGFTEEDQGQKLVELLKTVDELDLNGAIVHTWQDDWTSLSGSINISNFTDRNVSSYWYNSQASDEAFGLVAFDIDAKRDFYLDGGLGDWEKEDYIIDDKIRLKVKARASHLYLLLEKKDLDFDNEELFLGIDVISKSGSKIWKDQEARFDLPVDFIVHIKGYEDSRILVQERYDRFEYLYKYYNPIVEKKDNVPVKDSPVFSPLYILNRKRFYFPDKEEIVQPIYYETGKLKHGIDDPNHPDYNSLADFYRKGDYLQVKIPWDMLNVKNPLDMFIYDDFYLLGAEKSLKDNSLGFSIYHKDQDKVYGAKKVHKVDRNKKKPTYVYRLKKSYYILKDYWSDD